MAHFAQLDKNNSVIRVIVVGNQDILDSNGNESEEVGIEFCKGLYGEDTDWKQTSYSGSFRKRYAGRSDTYNETLDAFIQPKPYKSWILNQTIADWESPVGPKPELTEEEIDSGSFYRWNEETLSWDLMPPLTE